MQIELADCTNVIVRECSMPELKQADVAETYAMALVSTWPTDWAVVNAAIVARWPKGLERVKKRAWKIVEDKRRERLAAIAERN